MDYNSVNNTKGMPPVNARTHTSGGGSEPGDEGREEEGGRMEGRKRVRRGERGRLGRHGGMEGRRDIHTSDKHTLECCSWHFLSSSSIFCLTLFGCPDHRLPGRLAPTIRHKEVICICCHNSGNPMMQRPFGMKAHPDHSESIIRGCYINVVIDPVSMAVDIKTLHLRTLFNKHTASIVHWQVDP